jgi:hypothetical protein
MDKIVKLRFFNKGGVAILIVTYSNASEVKYFGKTAVEKFKELN